MKLLLQKEVQNLKKDLLALGAVVEELLRKSVKALQERDVKLAREVIDADELVDNREVELEESGLKIIALHQPVAIDLRFIVSVLRINSDLERIGDLAVNIAERATYLAGAEALVVPIDFTPMAEKAQQMLTRSLDAFVNMDSTLGRQILDKDNEVDAMNRQMYCTIYELIRKNPEDVEVLLHLLSASRHLERIADHATNIAEDVIYMVEGKIVRHKPEEYQASESCEGKA